MRQNPHVRICGGPGSATTLVYPTAARQAPWRADAEALAHREPQVEAAAMNQ